MYLLPRVVMRSLFLLLSLLIGTVCASANTVVQGPSFTDLAFLPSTTSLYPSLVSPTVQILTLDPLATNFTFDFSLSNPDQFTQNALVITLASASVNIFTPAVNLTLSTFSTDISIPVTTSAFILTITLQLTPTACNASSTPLYCSNTYTIHAFRAFLPGVSQSDYIVLWIIIGVLGGAVLLAVWLLFVVYKSSKHLRRFEELRGMTEQD